MGKLQTGLKKLFRSPFFYALAPTLLFAFIILKRRWSLAHDSFHLFLTNYNLFNEFVTNFSFPLWYPYDQLGVNANWYIMRMGPSLAALLPFAKIFTGVNFYHIYYASLFLDELILLVGTYLLARSVFKSPLAAIFVSIAATGSTFWVMQIYFNFHFYYFIPLALYYGLTGCRDNALWKTLFGGSLLMTSLFGSLLYASFPLALAYLIFTGTCVWVYKTDVRAALRNSGRREFLAIAFLVTLMAVYAIILAYGADYEVFSPDRGKSYTVGADIFLSYPGHSTGMNKFAELFTGIPYHFDYNIYSGVLVLSLAVFGLIWAPSRFQLPFLFAGAWFALFSMSELSIVAPFSYYLPFMNFYRHIGYLVSVMKIFLIVLAGFGFDALATDIVDGKLSIEAIKSAAKINAAIILFMLAVFGALVLLYFQDPKLIVIYNNPFPKLEDFISRAGFMLMVYAAALAVFAMLYVRGAEGARTAVYALLILSFIDVYSYRSTLYHKQLINVPPDAWAEFKFKKTSYLPVRKTDYFAYDAFKKFSDSRLDKKGAMHSIIEQALGIDMCESQYHPYLRRPDVAGLKRSFSLDDPRYRKIIGCEYPKLRVFSTVAVIDKDDDFFDAVKGTNKTSDVLFASKDGFDAYDKTAHDKNLLTLAGPRRLVAAGQTGKQEILRRDDTVRAVVEVTGFSANEITLKVITTQPGQGSYWLYYADGWHPFWKAYVNGTEVPILKANYAFKAIEVGAGESTVKFRYSSKILSAALFVMWALLAGVMVFVLRKAYLLLAPPDDKQN